MPSVLWVSLPRQWKLEEVQAGLQVVVALLSTWGIYAFSRFCWQLSSNLVRKNRAVALASLMSISTIGEAFDIIALLKQRIFRQRYWKLLAQSVIVISLTVATIVSGPIAKASTRYGTVIRTTTVPGLLASRNFNSRTYANVDWNATAASLDRANFPLDQMLDFLPQTDSNWVYRADEWNSTWKMDCTKTQNTPISVVGSGTCGSLFVELPVTTTFFNYTKFVHWETDWHTLYLNSTWLQDGMLVFAGWNYPGFDKTTNVTYNMTITLAYLHIHGMKRPNATSKCNFAQGPVSQASYTKMECILTRPVTIPDPMSIAFPDSSDRWAVPEAIVANYFDRLSTEANTDKSITMVSPEELIRFYQTYVITKDLQYPHPVSRKMTASMQVVQLSSTFIAFGSLYALLVILGLINFAVFAYRNKDVMRETPVSKLDWIVQSILDDSPTRRASMMARKSVVTPSIMSKDVGSGSEKVRTAFENAKYGGSAVEEMPLTDNASPHAGSTYSQSPNPNYGFPMSPEPYDNHAGGTTPFYNMNPYEAAYATDRINTDYSYELQNPQNAFASDRRRGYQRLI